MEQAKTVTSSAVSPERVDRRCLHSYSDAILRTIDLHDLYDLCSSCESSDGSSDLFTVTTSCCDGSDKFLGDSAGLGLGPVVGFKVC